MTYPYRYERGGAGAQYASGQLPIGWQSAYSPEGDVYYIDHNTRTTHWQIPQEVLQSMGQGSGYRVGRVRRGIDRTKLKTKMCMNIQNGGKCTWGDSCAFAHTSDELSAVPHGGGGGGQRGGGGARGGGGMRGVDAGQPYFVHSNGVAAPVNGAMHYEAQPQAFVQAVAQNAPMA